MQKFIQNRQRTFPFNKIILSTQTNSFGNRSNRKDVFNKQHNLFSIYMNRVCISKRENQQVVEWS